MKNKTINSKVLGGTIYGSVTSTNDVLVLDVRNVKDQKILYYEIDLKSMEVNKLEIENTSWWMKLIGADANLLYFIKYTDRNDPNSQVTISITKSKNQIDEVLEIPYREDNIIQPSLYENGTEYHKMVSDFLGLELPLSCEYLEWKDKIIISYYLRFGNEFDRYLLLLDNGRKEWKLQQDHNMKGFSPEAFFVMNDQLIFFKELNEVCTYTL